MTREEAIKTVRNIYQTDAEKEALETLIPELAESEDERIRKALIDYVKKAHFLDEDSILAYLEKQKEEEGYEAIPVENTLEYKLGFKAGKESEKQKEQKPNIEICPHSIKSKSYLETGYPIEQKPEWKPQPESLEALMYAIEGDWEKIKPTGYLSRRLEDLYDGLVNTFNVDETFLAELPKVAAEEDIEGLKVLKRKIEESMEQKPEWSEEDKLNLMWVISILKGEPCDLDVIVESLISWLEALPKNFTFIPKPQWDDKDAEMYFDILAFLENLSEEDERYIWFKNLAERGLPPKQEWSEEDEDKLNHILEIVHIASGREVSIDEKEELESFLKSLRPQSKDEIYKRTDETYKLGKHHLAVKFMNYLDDNRPEGKMGLSINECESIDKAFKENDWATIMRYVDKYRPSWKPSEEQMKALRKAVKKLAKTDVSDSISLSLMYDDLMERM